MIKTLFLVLCHTDHEGFDVLSTHRSVAQAEGAVAQLLSPDSNADGLSVLAVSPGPGRGVTVARWAAEWMELDLGHGLTRPGVRWKRVL